MKKFNTLIFVIALLFFSNTFTNAQPFTDCPDNIAGFTTIGEYENSKYYVSNQNALNALDAQAIAESYGGNLASIHSQAQNDFIQQGISEMTYIGLNDRQMEGVLEWYDGSSVDYTNFDFCIFCNENSSSVNNVMMHHWNGGWSWSNTSNPRKFVMEIPCGSSGPVSISYGCPLPFPQEGNWKVPVTIRNNTSFQLFAAVMYLHQEYQYFVGSFPNLLGQVSIPPLAPGESVTVNVIADLLSFPRYLPNLTYFSSGSHPYTTYGDYYLSLDVTGATKTTVIDFYCKKYTTDLAVEIQNTTPTYGTDNMVKFSLEVTNNGNEKAYNIRTNILKTILTIGPPPFPFMVEPSNMSDGTFRRLADGEVVWLLENLEVGESATVDVIYHIGFGVPSIPDEYELNVSVTSGHLIDPILSNNMDTYLFSKEISTGCPNNLSGFTVIGEFGNNKYFLSDGISRPADAQALAESYGGNLASIGSQAENDFIQQGISEVAYIGLNDYNNENTLAWTDGSAVNYTNFDICNFCNANSADMDFVMMHPWNGGWSWSNFYNQRKYVIEIPCGPTPGVDLALSMSTPVEEAFMGDVIPATLTVTNQGAEEATNIFIRLSRSNDLNLQSANPSLGTFEPDYYLYYKWEIPVLQSGQTAQVDIIFIAGATRFSSYTAGATLIDLDQMDTNPDNDVASIGVQTIFVGGCPPSIAGFTTLGNFGSNKYYLSNEVARPEDARMIAQSHAGNLVVISNQEENDFLQQHISEPTYIGLNDYNTEGNLEWVNGDAVNFTNFDICNFCYENSEDMDFVMMHPWNGGWSWSNFYNQRKYIIEVSCIPSVPFNVENTLIGRVENTAEKMMIGKVFPNPADSKIHVGIRSAEDKTIELRIVDVRGQVLKVEQVGVVKGENTADVNIDDLPEGMYFLLIPETNGKHKSQRFVKFRE